MSTRAQLAMFLALAVVATGLGLIGARACASPTPPRAAADRSTSPIAPPLTAPLESAAPLDSAPLDSAPSDTLEAAPVTRDALPLAPLPTRARLAPRETRPVERTRDVVDAGVAKAKASVDAGVVAKVSVDAGVEPAIERGIVDAGVVIANAAPRDAGVRVEEAVPSAPFTIVYRDELSWLKLVELRVFVDGKRLVDEKEPKERRERTLLETRVFPGSHQVRVEAVYVGDGGLFGYMDAYRFKLREMMVVDVRKGTRVLAHAMDRGALVEWEKRPALKLSTQ